MTRHTVVVALWVLAGLYGSLSAADPAGTPQPIRPVKGDTIVFFGDSITKAGDRPSGYIQAVRRFCANKTERLDLRIINAGISGHMVPNLQRRLDRDVLKHKPAIVVIYIGINDVWYTTRGRGTSKEAFEKGLRDLIARIRGAKARVVLCTPSVIGEKHDGTNRVDKILDEYSEISRKVARDTGVVLLDLRKIFLAELKVRNKDNKPKGILTGDGLHLSVAGNDLVARNMLDVLGLTRIAAAAAPATQPASQPTSMRATGPAIKSWDQMRDVRVPLPTEFASVFSFGYMNDIMPKTPEAFEKLLVQIKAGGFNVIHCAYKDWRLELCRKHGVKMMVDLLARPYRFFTDRDRVQALCISLRGDKAVWGYNLWNDKFGPHGPGLNQRMVRIRTWDPTHPTFAGTYRTIGIKHLRNTDCFGYYDYHWTRGRHNNFLHLSIYRYWVMRRNAIFLRWTDVTCGRGYKQIRQRAGYTINTSIAWGMKGSLWFLGQNMVKGGGWSDAGRAITEVNHEVMPIRAWIMKIGNPTTVVSTQVKHGSGKLALPKYTSPVPKDFWLQPTAGEFLMGVFQDKDKRDYIFCANHSISAEQAATIRSARPVSVELFDRKQGQWKPLEVKDDTFSFRIAPSGGELLRLTSRAKP